MQDESTAFRRLDLSLWAAIAAVAAVVFAAPLFSGFQLVWATFLLPGIAFAALLAAAAYYDRKRPDVRLASALGGTGQLIAFSAVAAPLSYIAASAGAPLQDSLFDAADRAMRLDWRAMLAWMNDFSAWHPVFAVAYGTFPIQASIVVIWLGLSGRLARLRVFVLAFMIAAVVSIAISALVPAQGVWGYYDIGSAEHPAINPITREQHLATFHGLRDGSFRQLLAFGSEGIITFPSMHAAVAAILALAFWPVPVLRWVALGVNAIMIVSTPVDGGHYFIDVVAGLAIAFASWAAASSYVKYKLADSRDASAVAAAPASAVSRLARGK